MDGGAIVHPRHFYAFVGFGRFAFWKKKLMGKRSCLKTVDSPPIWGRRLLDEESADEVRHGLGVGRWVELHSKSCSFSGSMLIFGGEEVC